MIDIRTASIRERRQWAVDALSFRMEYSAFPFKCDNYEIVSSDIVGIEAFTEKTFKTRGFKTRVLILLKGTAGNAEKWSVVEVESTSTWVPKIRRAGKLGKTAVQALSNAWHRHVPHESEVYNRTHKESIVRIAGMVLSKAEFALFALNIHREKLEA